MDFADKALRALLNKHGNRVSDIFRGENLRGILGAAAGKLRGHAARADDTDSNAIAPQILSHASCQTHKTPFRGAIHTAAREGVFPGQRTDIDDVAAAALNHERRDGPGDQEDALQVGIDNAVPVTFRFFVRWAESGIADARVVHKDRDGPEMFFRGAHKRGDGLGVRDIRDLRVHLGTNRADFPSCSLKGLRVATTEADRGAHLSKLCGDGSADAAAAPGDKGHVPPERFLGTRSGICPTYVDQLYSS